MAAELDLWRIAAGLGLFLFGMHELEASLKQLAGRSFKRFLRQYTAKPLRGVLAGAATAGSVVEGLSSVWSTTHIPGSRSTGIWFQFPASSAATRPEMETMAVRVISGAGAVSSRAVTLIG